MDMSDNEKKISSPKKETKNLKETKTKIEEKNQSETHPLDDGEVINPDLIKEYYKWSYKFIGKTFTESNI